MKIKIIDRERVINMVNSLSSWKLITDNQAKKIVTRYDKLKRSGEND